MCIYPYCILIDMSCLPKTEAKDCGTEVRFEVMRTIIRKEAQRPIPVVIRNTLVGSD